jgi:5-methylcytosine-specific restriction enzyme B
MSIAPLINIVHAGSQGSWQEQNKTAFNALFGSPEGRYPKSAAAAITLRAPEMTPEFGVPFAAYIHPSNPPSGPYSGLSFVLFPVPDQPCLIGMGVGTQGLTPDEAILGRPGHARKTQAICSWLNRDYGNGELIAWAKQDPTRTDVSIPTNISRRWSEYKSVFERYGREMYAVYRPRVDRVGTDEAVTAFLDLLFEERGYQPISNCQASSDSIRGRWFEHLMPSIENKQVADLLATRHYVIIQGPPGTGKTRMATELLSENYEGRGQSRQFHPNTTYETFIGGLAPVIATDAIGLRFQPSPGFLMEAAAGALADPTHRYLLHIDEINRADLGKILGEAIFLLEPTDSNRKVNLAYDFGTTFHRTLFLPDITPSTKLMTLFRWRHIGRGVPESNSSPMLAWPV